MYQGFIFLKSFVQKKVAVMVCKRKCLRHNVDSDTRVIMARARPVNGHAVTVFIAGAVVTRKACDTLICKKNVGLDKFIHFTAKLLNGSGITAQKPKRTWTSINMT